MSLSIIITRHNKKAKQVDIPGSDEDKQVDLSEEGKARSIEIGKKIIHRCHDRIYLATSDFLRAMTTGKKMLEGAGYDPDNKDVVTSIEDSLIGFSGVDWNSRDVPSWKTTEENLYVRQLLEGFYRPTPGRNDLPCMAGYAFALLDVIINGIKYHAERGSKSGLINIVTHGGVIDPLGGALAGYLVPDTNKKVHNYPGEFKTGEYIGGCAVDAIGDPKISFFVKGKDFTHALSDLKKMRDVQRENSQYK